MNARLGGISFPDVHSLWISANLHNTTGMANEEIILGKSAASKKARRTVAPKSAQPSRYYNRHAEWSNGTAKKASVSMVSPPPPATRASEPQYRSKVDSSLHTTAPPLKPFFLAPSLCWIPWPTLNEMYIRSISFVCMPNCNKSFFRFFTFDPEYFKSMLI
jgi:hypothetical protein